MSLPTRRDKIGLSVMLDHADKSAYYASALAGLRFVEHRRPSDRRFGRDADARWNAFKGHLHTIDRIDLMVRDADAQWPRSFGARTVFGFRAVAEDDAFGAEWQPLDPVHAEELWRSTLAQPSPTDVRSALAACANAWQLKLTPTNVGAIGPADKLLVVGPSAVATAVEAFSNASGLDWADQVMVVATPPAHRQLAALAGALLNLTRAPQLFSPKLDPAMKAKGRRLILSPDADAGDAEWARAQAGT